MKKYEIVSLILFVFNLGMVSSCNSNYNENDDIVLLVKGEKPCSRIKGFLEIGRLKDSSLYYLFFENMRDQNITHCTEYYGRSVLWAKIESLRKITHTEPTVPYDPFKPDPEILEFYKTILAKQQKY